MTSSKALIDSIIAPPPGYMPKTVEDFLHQLRKPTAILLRGRQPGKRIITTLLHANEPSGFRVLYRLLCEGYQPAVDTSFIVASPQAAQLTPLFSHRQLPQQRDLNRCFAPPYDDYNGHIAKAIIDFIIPQHPEFIIDIHNTSGRGPAFAVSTRFERCHIALCSYFSQWLIHTDIALGSIMEVPFTFPILTVEAGGCEDEKSDETMYNGLKRLLSSPAPFQQQQSVDILYNPARLRLAPDASVAFADRPVFGSDVSLSTDIEALNFGKTNETSLLGWTDCHEMNHFNLQGGTENATIDEYFIIKNGEIRPRAGLKIFMATPRLDIARDDCLLYFIDLNKQLTHIPQGIAEQDTNLATVR